MAVSVRHGVAGYNAGCRCQVCKAANSEYRKDLRQRQAEAVGDPSVLRMIRNDEPVTCGYAEMGRNVAAVQAEIDALSHKRPGLAEAALTLASALDNPKAMSSWPAASAQLRTLLDQLHKSGDGRKSKLASVRSMTSGNSKTG